ncbi:hypothetical protein QQ020_10180 [Fulvivirgaceae bacterium BMA12]|uniref:DUF2490 domain-containing protein n=1 Tax=Agaribacillus aureus TaxID=3051825 RepID=A0ABT8L580_9BACT|nr:hypothetical protein [Fulvivirgaceae bacterium BMA12]
MKIINVHFEKQLYCLGLLIFITVNSFAQQGTGNANHKNTPEKQRYLISSLTSKRLQLRDQHMSPVTYFGGIIAPGFGMLKRKEKFFSEFSLNLALGSIQAKNGTELRPMRGDYFRIDMQYSYLRFVKNIANQRFRWYVGGKLKSHANVRLNEQLDTGFITFIFTNGLSLSSALERDINLFGRKMTLSYQLDLPVVTHVIRPNYLNIYNYIDPENDWLEERLRDSDWLLPGKFTSINSQISLTYPIKAGNMVRLSYGWEYYSLNNKLKARNASHDIALALLFNF